MLGLDNCLPDDVVDHKLGREYLAVPTSGDRDDGDSSVLLGGDGPTVPCSLVVMSWRSLSHPSCLAAASTEVTMSYYL